MFKKEFLGVKIYIYFIFLLIALLGILFGSLFDFQISSKIVNTSSGFGGFMESFGLTFSYAFIIIGGLLLFKGLNPSKNKYLKILSYFFLILCYGIALYYGADALNNGKDISKVYGITFNPILSYLITAIYLLMVELIFYPLLKVENRKLAIIIGSMFLIGMLLETLSIELIKNLNCRPRYRFITNSELNTSGITFRSWWEFSPFTAINDHYKSFPSGHTGSSSTLLLLPFVAPFIRIKVKYIKLILCLFGCVYNFSMMFARIYYGAHFLSDVSFALLISLCYYILLIYVADRIYKKIKDNVDVENSQITENK